MLISMLLSSEVSAYIPHVGASAGATRGGVGAWRDDGRRTAQSGGAQCVSPRQDRRVAAEDGRVAVVVAETVVVRVGVPVGSGVAVVVSLGEAVTDTVAVGICAGWPGEVSEPGCAKGGFCCWEGVARTGVTAWPGTPPLPGLSART